MSTTSASALSKVVTVLNSGGHISPVYPVHNYHAVADLDLPSITVEVESNVPSESDKAFYAGSFVHNHHITLSIRVHTSYSGMPEDSAHSVTVMDEVITALNTNLNLADGYRIISFGAQSYNIEFAESKSVGAELKLVVHKVSDYVN